MKREKSAEKKSELKWQEQIAANAAKIVAAKRAPAINRETLGAYLRFRDPDDAVLFSQWQGKLNKKVRAMTETSVRFSFDRGTGELLKKEQAIEVEHVISAERDPIAPASIVPQKFNVYSATQHSPDPDAMDKNNEDFSTYVVMPDGSAYIIALDGMGSYGHGDQAARIAGVAFRTAMMRFWMAHRGQSEVLRDTMRIQIAMTEAIQYAHGQLRQNPVLKGTRAGAVLVAMAVSPLKNDKSPTVIMHMGDTRAHLVRAGKPLMNLTMDNFISPRLHSVEDMNKEKGPDEPHLSFLRIFSWKLPLDPR